MVKLKPLDQQVIVITGASSGIGLVTAKMAAAAGAKVVAAARNGEALDQLVNEIRGTGGQAICVVADVGVEDDINRVATEAITHFGTFDTWVNNAGVSIFGHIEDVTIPDMRRMFETVYWGVVYGSRAAVTHFRRTKTHGTGGALINVGSFVGDRAPPLQSTYASAKHAVHGFTDALRMELEHEAAPVSVSLIHPGRIDTPYNEHARSYIPQQPAHRGYIYAPEAVADAILHCASHPKRDMFVGLQAKLAAVFGALAPRTMDKFMEAWLYPTQHSSRPSRSLEDNALYEAGYGGHERGTHEGMIYRSTSYYVQATKHPLLTTIALAGAAVLAGALVRSRSERS